jgi:hypothetical protein
MCAMDKANSDDDVTPAPRSKSTMLYEQPDMEERRRVVEAYIVSLREVRRRLRKLH